MAHFSGLKMHFVYILQSEDDPERHYVGCTHDLHDRLRRHNAAEVSHTAKFLPWRIKTYIAFSDEQRARDFEHYLKSPPPAARLRRNDCQIAAIRT